MDTVVQAATVLAAFSMVHERFVEYLRAFNKKHLKWAFLEQSTKDHRNVYWPTLLAFATHANLLALFQPKDAFFAQYLHSWHVDADLVQQIFGCVLMGFSTALGSKFWHDLASGLMDFRAQAQSNALKSDRPPPPAAVPPPSLIT